MYQHNNPIQAETLQKCQQLLQEAFDQAVVDVTKTAVHAVVFLQVLKGVHSNDPRFSEDDGLRRLAIFTCGGDLTGTQLQELIKQTSKILTDHPTLQPDELLGIVQKELKGEEPTYDRLKNLFDRTFI